MTQRPLWRLSLVNAAMHGIALAAAYFWIQPGSPLVPPEVRLRYLAGSSSTWIAAWATWVASALMMFAFTAALSRRLKHDAGRVALFIAAAAVALDLSCDAVFIGVFPWLARQPFPAHIFLTVERVTTVISLGIANTFYSLAVLAQSIALRSEPVPRGAVVAGILVCAFGLLLSLAGFTGVPWHAQWATVPTIVGYTIWSLWTAWSLDHAGAGR